MWGFKTSLDIMRITLRSCFLEGISETHPVLRGVK